MTASRLVSRSIKVHTRAPQGNIALTGGALGIGDVEGYQDGRLLKEQMCSPVLLRRISTLKMTLCWRSRT